ncbi:unnamed protein product [Arabis nemorensis]|uniref:CCHC-type domain-containing protein n=1 Tax=Arabis nemorensis TaxID=586526 RepID=A0A565CAL8_9BRAS|nr:unnamed protein product [Arabis nemorensis]
MAILEKARIENKYCETIRSSTNLYEVVEFNKGYTVRLDSHECACRRWDLTDNKEDAEKYVAEYYAVVVVKNTYEDNIKPVNGEDMWSDVEKPAIGIPEIRKPRGRHKLRDRRKEPFEDLQKPDKSTRRGRIQHCSNYGETGHIIRSCKNDKVIVEGPKNKQGRLRKHPKDVIPKRPTQPRKKKQTTTSISNTQPAQPAEASGSYPAASSAPQPSVSTKKQPKKRKRGPPLKISEANTIPTVSGTLMSPFTARAFDVFTSFSRGSHRPSGTPSEPKKP